MNQNILKLANLFIEFGNMLNESAKEFADSNSARDTSLLSEEETLKKYNFLSHAKLLKASENEGLPFYKIGRKRYYKISDIDNWLDSKVVITYKDNVCPQTKESNQSNNFIGF
jgi:hypothetical protein